MQTAADGVTQSWRSGSAPCWSDAKGAAVFLMLVRMMDAQSWEGKSTAAFERSFLLCPVSVAQQNSALGSGFESWQRCDDERMFLGL